MGEVGELALRLVVSLTVVLAVVGVGYAVARRKQRGLGAGATSRRRQRAAGPATLEVEARAGLARGSAAVAVRFADRIVLVAITDGAPATALADIPAADWDRPPEPVTDESPDGVTGTVSTVRTPLDPNGVVSERPSFLDALRDATSRRP